MSAEENAAAYRRVFERVNAHDLADLDAVIFGGTSRDCSRKHNLDKPGASAQCAWTGPVPSNGWGRPTAADRMLPGDRKEGVILLDDSPPHYGGTLFLRAADR